MPKYKWEELEGLELGQFRPYLREQVLIDGKPTYLYELSRRNANGTYSVTRGTLENLESLIRLGMTDANRYRYARKELGWSEPVDRN